MTSYQTEFELNASIEAGIDNQRRQRSSKLNLAAHLALAGRLNSLAECAFFASEECFAEFTKSLTGYDLQDAYRLLRLDTMAQQVLDRCEVERARAIAADRPYEYPDWRTALGWFWPEHDDRVALRRRVVELEAEVADLEDQLANPVPQRDSKRWFEQELLAVTWGIFKRLSITVADGQTVIRGMDDDRLVFLRVIIPRTFPGMSSMAWINIKRDRFDKAPVRAGGEHPTIADILWDKTLDVADVAAVVAQATGESIAPSALGLEDDDPGVYSLAHLKRLLRKKPTTLRIRAKGVLGGEILRNDITYEYFIRAVAQ